MAAMTYKQMQEELAAAKPASLKAASATPNAALIKAIMAGIAPVLHEHISQEIAKATAPLQARIADLERKGYVGVWKAGKEYSPQSEVTCDGARWLAHKRTSDKPGASADWSLIEKATTSHARNGSAGPTARPRPP